jgi:hypothetical protein
VNPRALLSGPASGYLVSAVTVVGAVVLAAFGRAIPDQLWTLAEVGLGAGAGATFPRRLGEPSTSSQTTSSTGGAP